MVAQRDYLPLDERERAEVSDVLANNPDIQAMVEMIAGHATSSFSWVSVKLDTRQYDEWDPPLRMTITVPYFNQDDWTSQYDRFMTWLAESSGYKPDRLSVMLLSHDFRSGAA